jgi:hypothetical protein
MSRIACNATVGDLVERGIEDVNAFCVGCGATWRSPITFLPQATTLEKVAALVMCPTCGARDIEVEAMAGGRTVQ